MARTNIFSLFRIKNQAPLWRVFGQSILVFFENDLNTSAAAISYFVMLMLFPLLVLLLSLGQSIVGGEVLRQFLVSQVLGFLPGTHEFIRDQLLTIERLPPGALVGCALLIFWATSWVFTVIERAMNRIWMTQPRSFLHGRLITTGMVGASGAVLLLSAALASLVAILQSAVERLPIHLPGDLSVLLSFAWQAAFGLVSLLISIGLFLLIYKAMPNTRVYWIEAVPGAVTSGVAWELLKYGFAHILPAFLEEYRALYGGIWLALVLLTWVYISSIVMLFGAQFTALLHCERVFARESSQSSYPIERDPASVA